MNTDQPENRESLSSPGASVKPERTDGPTRWGRVRRAAEVLAIVVGLLLILVVTIAVTVLKPEQDADAPEAVEARRHLQAIYEAQTARFERTGAYTREFEDLGLAGETEHFRYTIGLRRGIGSFAAYALWKEPPAGRARRFMRLDGQGRITQVPRRSVEPPRREDFTRRPDRDAPETDRAGTSEPGARER